MAMNLEAVLRIAAKVVGLDEVTALERGLAGAEKAAGQAQGAFKAVVSSASWQAAAAGAAGLAVALGTSAKAAMDFESSMADVRKVVPGLESAEGLKAMKDEILNLSRVLPVSAEGLAEIMAAAGQAGIAREELGQFTKQAAQMGIAFDISAAEAGEVMAKLRTSLGLSQDEVVNLADAMNYLSNNMASSAAEIVDFMKRSGAVGKQVAMTTEQTAAFGSAMIAAGAAPEVAATSFNNLIKAMAKGESVTARQGAAFKRLGLDAVSVAKSMQTDAVGTIRDVFQRISQMPAEMRITTISEIFGDEARALTPLITNLKLFDQAMGLVGDSSNYTGSMLEEFNARAGTSANNWQLLQNNLKALQIVIGDALLPAINMTFNALTPLISIVANLAQRFPVLTAVVVGLTAALAAFILAAPAIVSFITLIGSLKAAFVAANIGGLIAGWLPAIIGFGSSAVAALGGLLAWITGTLLPGLLAVFSGPVGWTVLAIAAVVAMAIAFREPIMKFFSWLGGAIASGLEALWRWGEPIRQFWFNAWENVKAVVGGFFSWFGDALYKLYVEPWVKIGDFVANAALTAWNNVKTEIGKFFSWFGGVLFNLYVKPWQDLGALLLNAARTAWDGIKGFLGGWFAWWGETLYKLFVEPWVKLATVLLDAARTAWDGIKGFLGGWFAWWGETLYKLFVEPWVKLGPVLLAAATTAWNNVKTEIGKFFSWFGGVLFNLYVKPWQNLGSLLVGAAQALWTNIRNVTSSFFDWFGDALNAYLITPWNRLTDQLVTIATTAWDRISDTFDKNVIKPVQSAWSKTVTFFRKTANEITDGIKAGWVTISDFFKTRVVEPIKSLWQGLQTWLQDLVDKAAKAVGNAFSGIANGIRSAFQGIVNSVGAVINNVIGMINRLIEGVNRVRATVNLSPINLVPQVKIPAFAAGGFVNGATVGLVGEAEPEYIIPESKMAAASSRFLSGARGSAVIPSGSGGGGSSTRQPVINITTGPVMEFQGERYVKIEELDRAARQITEKVFGSLRTPAARVALGMV